MIIVAGKLYVAAERRDAYLASCAEVVEQARKAPGCLDFALSADLLEPDRINVFEQWESAARLADFRGSGPSDEQAVQIRSAEIAEYELPAAAP